MMKRGLIAALTIAAGLLAGSGQAGARTSEPSLPDTQLLRMYQPVTILDSQEPFAPAAVQSFIADSELEQFVSGAWQVASTSPEPGELPGPGSGTWRLNQMPCSPATTLGGLACYQQAWADGSGGSVVYGRVARHGESTVLQYWYFYYDDVYSYSHLANDPIYSIWQAHEGDWEVVNVVLDESLDPVEAGYSQHACGELREWGDTQVEAGTHPVVYVALGSHANYFEPGLHPITCLPPQVLPFISAFKLAPMDRADGGGLAEGPPGLGDVATTIHRATTVQHWLTFPGFWGESQYFHFTVGGQVPPGLPAATVPLGESPTGPMFHSVWESPLETMASWTQG